MIWISSERFVTATGRECNSLLQGFLLRFGGVQSKFYQPDERRAEKVHELFATIARRYDLLNDVMTLGLHRHWKRRLVELAVVGRVTPRGAASGDAAYNR